MTPGDVCAISDKHDKQIRNHGRFPLRIEGRADFCFLEFAERFLDNADGSLHDQAACGDHSARGLLSLA